MTAVRLPVEQGTEPWLAARRDLITATDIGVLLGLNPWKVEAQLAAEKRGEWAPAETLRMRLGTALEPFIASEYTENTGRRLRRFHGLHRHASLTWAAASPDYGVVGERRLVELKHTGSRTRFADGLPQDVEAQVAWQLMVMDYPAADVAVLVADDLRIFEVERNRDMEPGLVAIAEDFRRRLAAGGPFAENAESLKVRYPSDNGAEMLADTELSEAVRALVSVRETRRMMQDDEDRIESAIKARMGEFATLAGDGFRVSWKRTKDVATTDWRSVADGLLRQLPETEREALVGLATTVRPGFRPFRVVLKGDTE